MNDAPTLLLVDDEAAILNALRRALRREGYRILTASGVDEALRILDAESIDAIVSDHKMPRASGLELLEAARARHPAAARILITGWPDAVPEDRRRSLGLHALLPKPWEADALKQVLRDALGR
ncbi:MAG: response regulator [Myxococcota bacterium]|nr:response regulator [Myxococcota bacterium]